MEHSVGLNLLYAQVQCVFIPFEMRLDGNANVPFLSMI